MDTAAINAAVLAEFGQAATYNGAAITEGVVFHREPAEMAGMTSYDTWVECLTSTATRLGIAARGTLVTGGNTYTVRAPQEDEGGMTKLILEKR